MTVTTPTDLATHYINGTWTTDWAGPTNELRNPATGQVTGRVALAGPDEVDRAVAAARAAFETYSHTSVEDRMEMFGRIAAEFTRHAEDLAVAVTTDMGIPIAGSRIAVGASSRWCSPSAPTVGARSGPEPSITRASATSLTRSAAGLSGWR